MVVETWVNQWHDIILFIDNAYALFDKCDRAGVEALCCSGVKKEAEIEELKLKCYSNGFRPVNQYDNEKMHVCQICEHWNKCCQGEGSIPCCYCNRVNVCPDHKSLYDNFKLNTIDIYEAKLKRK